MNRQPGGEMGRSTAHGRGAVEVDGRGQPAHTRRAVLAATGVVGTGTLLAACGGGGGAGGDSASPSGPVTIDVSGVPVGGGTIDAPAQVVVTRPASAEYKAFSAVCTHAGCLVASVASGEIVCPCHGSAFDIATGDVVNGPATQPLPSKPVTVSDGTATVT